MSLEQDVRAFQTSNLRQINLQNPSPHSFTQNPKPIYMGSKFPERAAGLDSTGKIEET
jgi:hypothetical protein